MSDILWDPIGDINSYGQINMVDIGTVARHFGARVDGGNCKKIDLPVSFIWQVSTSHTFSFQSPLASGQSRPFVWTGTSGLSTLRSGSITVTANGSVMGNYKIQYYLTVASLHGSPGPPSGWFDSGSQMTASVTSPVSGDFGTRYVCRLDRNW